MEVREKFRKNCTGLTPSSSQASLRLHRSLVHRRKTRTPTQNRKIEAATRPVTMLHNSFCLKSAEKLSFKATGIITRRSNAGRIHYETKSETKKNGSSETEIVERVNVSEQTLRLSVSGTHVKFIRTLKGSFLRKTSLQL